MQFESFNFRNDPYSPYFESLGSNKVNTNPTKSKNPKTEQTKIKTIALLEKIFGLNPPCSSQTTKELMQKISPTLATKLSKPQKIEQLLCFKLYLSQLKS